MSVARLRVAWISDFGIEWLPGLPSALDSLPKDHPMTWQRVLLDEFEKREDIELHIIVLRKNLKANVRFERHGVSFHVLKTMGGLRAPSFFWLDTILIRRLLKSLNPDVVHAWGIERGAGLVASRMAYPYVLTIQALVSWYMQETRLGAYHRFSGLFERRSLERATIVTTESTFSVGYLRQNYPGVVVRQVEHAPSRLFHEIRRRPQTSPLRFLSVGTFGHRKGTDLLLQAFAQLMPDADFQLVIIGGDSHDAYLTPFRSALPAELWKRIEFRNNLSPAEVAAEMSAATLLVLPTRADTSPNAVKEAAVAGLPVIASEVGGIPDYVKNGRNGLLFPADNVHELVKALRSACRHPLFSRGEVDPETLGPVREYLSPTLMGHAFGQVYRDALSARHHAAVRNVPGDASQFAGQRGK